MYVLNYRSLSLLELIERIVKNSDRLALRELHENRRVFSHHGSSPLRMAEYVDILRKEARPTWPIRRNLSELADEAYGLTIDKFNNLPPDEPECDFSKDMTSPTKVERTDCRFYFSAFLTFTSKKLKISSPRNQFEEEALAAASLKNLVKRHFEISLLECNRRPSALVSRYRWKIKGFIIILWFPTYIRGRDRGRWLKENIKDLDFNRPDEIQRIQSIIDALLPRQRAVSLIEEVLITDSKPLKGSFLPLPFEKDFTQEGLARAVAKDKIETIDRQRPAIKALGEEDLTCLILQIFEDLSIGDYKEVRLASLFGLSKATFNRFAGSHWLKKDEYRKKAKIPDLWLNTAHTVASNPNFVEGAKEAGVWKGVEDILNSDESARLRKKHDVK